jgi:hypothetical protein
MLSTALRSKRRKQGQTKVRTFSSNLTLVKDLLDVLLKSSLIFLTLPALAVFSYLRAIHRVDLFLPAVFSVDGLVALLQATFILCASVIVGIVGPSWFASFMVQTYAKGTRPMPGAATLIFAAGVAAVPFYLGIYYLQTSSWPFWLKFVAGTSLGIVLTGGLFVVALLNLSVFRVLTESERRSRKQSLLKAGGRTLVACWAAIFTVSAVAAIYSFSQSYGLPEEGWRGNLVVSLIIVTSLWPGAVYIFRRSHGDSPSGSFFVSSAILCIPVVCLLLAGVSPEPLALLTMRAMGVAETVPRTFELMSIHERPTYVSLGFGLKGESNFFDASIRFQFGDVKLICVDPYDAVSSWPGARGIFGRNSIKQPLPETGCITALKEEVRVVQLSKGFRATAKAMPGGTGPA